MSEPKWQFRLPDSPGIWVRLSPFMGITTFNFDKNMRSDDTPAGMCHHAGYRWYGPLPETPAPPPELKPGMLRWKKGNNEGEGVMWSNGFVRLKDGYHGVRGGCGDVESSMEHLRMTGYELTQ